MTAVPDLPVYGPDWRQDALCAQVGGDDWFPGFGDDIPRVQRAAQAVCGRCDVKAACLDYALTNDIRSGIWGGMTPRGRARVALEGAGTRIRPATHPTTSHSAQCAPRTIKSTPGGGGTPEPGGLAPSDRPEGLIGMLDARQGWAR